MSADDGKVGTCTDVELAMINDLWMTFSTSLAVRVTRVRAARQHDLSQSLQHTYPVQSTHCSLVMLWSRCPLPRPFCAARYKRSPAQVVLYLNAPPTPEPHFIPRDSRTLLKHWDLPRTDRSRLGKMAPKQATLGYVMNQRTLRCDCLLIQLDIRRVY